MTEQDGRTLAAARVRALAPRAAALRDRLGRPATLAVLAQAETAQARFVEIKQRGFREAGLELTFIPLRADADTAAVLDSIAALNRDPAVDGIFLQFPLPAAVDAQACADVIAPGKDIDASGSLNLGRVLAGSAAYLPAAPVAVLTLLEAGLGELHGRSIVVAGSDGVVERCIVVLGVARGATLCIIAPDDPALGDAAAGADAVVITGEVPDGDAFRQVMSGSVLLDAGYFLPPRRRGWLSERALQHVGRYLPQYGNVGPLTVAFLMEAVLQAAQDAAAGRAAR